MNRLREEISYSLSKEFPELPKEWHWTRAGRIIEHYTTPDTDEDILKRNDREFEKYAHFFVNRSIDGTILTRPDSCGDENKTA